MKVLLSCFLLFFIFEFNGTAQNRIYFPVKAHDDSGLSSFEVKWYSNALSAMNEPILFIDKTNNEVYRFTWLRSFHHPIAIRIAKQGDAYFICWKSLSGAGGYAPGKLIVNKQKNISKVIWNKFIEQIAGIDFWSMKTSVNETGLDGAQWILEGRSVGKYHVVDKWTPQASSDYYKCCDFLIGLTDLQFKGNEKY